MGYRSGMSNGSFTLQIPPFLLHQVAVVRDTAATAVASPAEAEALRVALATAHDVARTALAELRDVEMRLPEVMRGAEPWYALLSRYPSTESLAALDKLRRDADPKQSARLVRYGLLQAATVAAGAIAGLTLAPAVRLLFCEFVLNLARPKPQWAAFFEVGHIRFEEIVRVVTLRRFPAGQHDWNISRIPFSWLPRLRPRDLPRFLGELAALRGRPPMAVTHLNYMRPNPWVVLNTESQKSYHRIARSIELHPHVKGILTYSWFYCPSVKEVTPHLAWLRDFFCDNGARLFEMQPAPESSGFTVGSRRRQQLYASGRFRPRITMVVWRRREFLAWAKANQDLATQDIRLQLSGTAEPSRAKDGTDQ